MITHLLHLILTAILLLLLLLGYQGYGSAVLTWCGSRRSGDLHLVAALWIGWAVVLSLLQLVHLVTPLSGFVSWLILLPGVIYSLVTSGLHPRQLPDSMRRLVWVVVLCVLVLIMIWTMSRSMLAPGSYDTYLYYLNTIRWLESYAIVPGLGNLHGRLAFNQSHFVNVAFLNTLGPLELGRVLANNSIILLSLVTQGMFMRAFLALRKNRPIHLVVSFFLLLHVLGFIFTYEYLNSPAPDFVVHLIIVSIIVLTALWLTRCDEPAVDLLVALPILAAALMTVKLSSIAFSFAICAGVLLHGRAILRTNPSRFIKVGLVMFVMIGVWMVRGYILSGMPMYPSSFGYIGFEWSVAPLQALDEKNWIYSWARMRDVHWFEVLGNSNWLVPWYVKNISFLQHVLPVAVALVFTSLSLISPGRRNETHGRIDRVMRTMVLVIPPLAGLVVWFLTAPAVRFASAYFMTAPVTALMAWESDSNHGIQSPYRVALAMCILLVLSVPLVTSVSQRIDKVGSISLQGLQSTPGKDLSTATTDSGLQLFVPQEGDQVGDSPLPATPYPNRHLQLRTPGDLQRGFNGLTDWEYANGRMVR